MAILREDDYRRERRKHKAAYKHLPKGRWAKMRRPHPPEATRFFARVRQAILECPKCGIILRVHPKPRSRSLRPAEYGWDPRASRLTCHGCGKTFTIGLMAWPVAHGSKGQVPGGMPIKATRPTDQVPNERQLAQLRAEGNGWWMPPTFAKKANRPDDTNVTASCTCVEGGPRDPQCPLHRENEGR